MRKAFESLEARLRQIPADKVIPPRALRVHQCAAGLLAVANLAQGAHWKPRFEAFAKSGFWDIEHLHLLVPATRAMWHIRYMLDSRDPTGERALVPASIGEAAMELRNLMRTVCEFALADDIEMAPRLTYLRQGVGYTDLASDLAGYADIYRQRAAELQLLPKFYDPDDALKAAQYAETIARTYAGREPHQTAVWTDLLARAFTLVSECYHEVRSAALFLGRNEPDIEQTFPLLMSLGRKRMRRRVASDPAIPPSPSPDPSQPAS